MPDEGTVEWNTRVRVSYLDQHADLEPGMTIREVLRKAFSYLYEMEEEIREAVVEEIREEEGEYSIKALASGEKYYPESHPFETEIKAVTYNQLVLEKTAGGWKAQVVVDI